jgi:hypothetical protein
MTHSVRISKSYYCVPVAFSIIGYVTAPVQILAETICPPRFVRERVRNPQQRNILQFVCSSWTFRLKPCHKVANYLPLRWGRVTKRPKTQISKFEKSPPSQHHPPQPN